MNESVASLGQFHPLIADWFSGRYEAPTAIQSLAWPQIVLDQHVLISAPTGSGKTLTAFLYGINQLVSGAWPQGQTSVLYISPLKALNNDIHQNLMVPLAELGEAFRQAGTEFPHIRVATRSGDTPQSERRRMIKDPPEILITTPESLNIMLSGSRARTILETVKTVILDEIHAVLASKRGTHLITAVERVAEMAGEFQRIAVSATVKPLARVAAFVGGFQRIGESYEARKVRVVAAPGNKKIDLTVRFPAGDPNLDEGVWPTLVKELHETIERNRSTLIFVTTRSHAEKVALLLNEDREQPVAYSHHGSLSRELRTYVEKAMRSGELEAIVATNSLELGIDIGDLDEVVMVKTPPSVTSTLQRIGRAGHQVSATSRGTLYPLYGRDAVDAIVMAAAVMDQDIEEASPVSNPLDVLAQVIVSMTGSETWEIEELYATIRCSWAFHALDRRHFDLVVEMLAGRYSDSRIRELNPRVTVDRVEGTIRARDGSLMLLYQSGGTIPDRGYYGLRIGESGTKVGELDEEFVWERRVGESFMFGSQLWTITSIGDRDVQVVPGASSARVLPFWKAEARGRDVHYALRVLEFLEECEGHLEAGDLEQWLASRKEVDPSARSVALDYLSGQRDATQASLPHRHHVLVEHYIRDRHQRGHGHSRGSDSSENSQEVVIHCGWGASVNQPLSMIIAALWERRHGFPLEVFADDNCIMLLIPTEFRVDQAFGPEVCRELLRPGAIEELLRVRLERSGMFGALFRECAGRALLLPRGGFNRRMPLWLSRVRAKKLLAAVSTHTDFPILLETWRECLQDRFDLETLRDLLREISTGEIEVTQCSTALPSPFAHDVVWQQINLFMYRDDAPAGDKTSDLAADLIRTVATDPSLRPRIPVRLIHDLERRIQRLIEGYLPSGTSDLVDWISERIAIPANEFSLLFSAICDQHGEEAVDREVLTRRLCWIVGPHVDAAFLVSVDALPRALALLHCGIDQIGPVSASHPAAPADSPGVSEEFRATISAYLEGRELPPASMVAAEWLRYYGPRPIEWAHKELGIEPEIWTTIIEDLAESSTVVVGVLIDGDERQMVCDTDNLEYLLRMMRRLHRDAVKPVQPERLVAFWADRMGIAGDRGNPDALIRVLDRLFGFPGPAAAWETDVLPSRLSDYHPVWLDGLFKEFGLIWVGCGKERIAFCLGEDISLIKQAAPEHTEGSGAVLSELARSGPMGLFEIMEGTGLSSESVTELLWSHVWDGLVTNDSYETLRKGVATQFAPSPVIKEKEAGTWPGRRRAARSFKEWSATRPMSGKWMRLDGAKEDDPISRVERAKDRARLLLDRYGVLFRELIDREVDALTWSELFRALRLMELAGEVVGGSYVVGVHGPQFALPSALAELESAGNDNRIYWMVATDPASPCGLPFASIYDDLPSRIASNHLVFRGAELVMVSRRNGAQLDFSVAPGDADIVEMVAPLKSMVGRRYAPRSRVSVEIVNGVPTRESPYGEALVAAGFRADYRAYSLTARYR